jgi:hypothetical protein
MAEANSQESHVPKVFPLSPRVRNVDTRMAIILIRSTLIMLNIIHSHTLGEIVNKTKITAEIARRRGHTLIRQQESNKKYFKGQDYEGTSMCVPSAPPDFASVQQSGCLFTNLWHLGSGFLCQSHKTLAVLVNTTAREIAACTPQRPEQRMGT